MKTMIAFTYAPFLHLVCRPDDLPALRVLEVFSLVVAMSTMMHKRLHYMPVVYKTHSHR